MPSDSPKPSDTESHEVSDFVTDDHKPAKTAKEDKLPLHEKSLYGFGNQAPGVTTHLIDNQIQQVLVYGLQMSPVWKGIIIMVFRLWDAFSDPLMGWISDSTRTKWGRRRPYMLLGTILMAGTLPFVWQFNEDWSMGYIIAWMIIFGMVISTFSTVYNIPFQTLKMEMTPDYNERTSLNMWMTLIGVPLGILFGWVWKLSQDPFFTGQMPGEDPNTLLGIRSLAMWGAGLVLIFGLIPVLVSKERYYTKAKEQVREPFIKSVKETFQNKPFLMMLGIILAGNIDGLVLGMGGYISLYYVFDGDKTFAATFVGTTTTISLIFGFLAAPIAAWMARRWGKHRALMFNVGVHALVAFSILIFYNPNYPWLAAIPNILGGIMTGMFWVIIPAMKPDIVDEDELRTGLRREGSFESVFSWFLRFTMTIFGGLSGIFVVMVGFNIDLGTEQADGVFTKMKLLMASVPLLLGALQFYLVWKWPLTTERMAEIRIKLEKRRGKIDMQKKKKKA